VKILSGHFEGVAIYQISQVQNATAISVEFATPCNSRLIGLTERGTGGHSLRSLLDDVNRHLVLLACPLRWWSHTVLEFDLLSTDSSNVVRHSVDPTFNIASLAITIGNASSISKYFTTLIPEPIYPGEIGRGHFMPFRYLQDHGDCNLDAYTFFGREISYNFITCHPAEKYISFYIYTRPFGALLWLGIFTTLLSVSIWLKVGIRLLSLRDEVVLMAYKFLLEQGVWFSTKMRQNFKFRLVLGSTLLCCLVLTNSYRGILTSDMVERGLKIIIRTVKNYDARADLHGRSFDEWKEWQRL
jgi:hypothetical protein